MRRSGSAKSTLSMINRRATKYQKFINLSNVFLLTTSTILIFSAVILIKFYYLTNLSFWATEFYVTPVLMISLGVYTFLVCLFGFIVSGFENRVLIATYAVLLTIAFLVQLGSIFTALELRTMITIESNPNALNVELNQYGRDDAVTARWDDMQTNLHCCGATSFTTGYQAYTNTPFGQQDNSVPDSCCYIQSAGCGQGVLALPDKDASKRIFISGCVEILRVNLENDVVPMMIAYACVGVFLAIVELITVVLACAWIAQITRKLRREDKMWRHATAADDATDALNHETMC